MEAPKLDYESPRADAGRGTPAMRFPFVLLAAWAGAVMAGNLGVIVLLRDGRGAEVDIRAWLPLAAGAVAVLALLFRRRPRRGSGLVLLLAVALGLAPAAAAIARAYPGR